MKFSRDKIDAYWPKWREDIDLAISVTDRTVEARVSDAAIAQRIAHIRILRNLAVIMKALWWLLHPETP